MRIRKAKNQDLDAVGSLLVANDLPVEGVKDNFSSFIVAEHKGVIVGAIGLEKFGSVALLRSAVVANDHRGSGIGRGLVEKILEVAGKDGIEELFLLTTTAEDYFPRFGFARTTRSAVPAAVEESAEFQGACPETALVMTCRIASPAARP